MTVKVIDVQEGFSFIDGKLEFVTVNSLSGINRNSDVHKMKVTTTDGREFTILSNQLFESEEKFEQGESVRMKATAPYYIYGANEIWYLVDGVAKYIFLEDVDEFFGIKDGAAWRVIIPGIDKSYPSAEVAKAYEKYPVVDEDGVEHIHEGILGKLSLDDKQKKAVDDVKKAFEKARKAGVEFFFDCTSWDFYAYGDNGMKLGLCDPCEDLSDQETLVPLADEFKVERYFKVIGADDSIFCK